MDIIAPTASLELPDFSNYGYRLDRPLGYNKGGGRVAYLATCLEKEQPVVVKQFQFAQMGATWSDYEAYEREISFLKQLNHPSIPRYLDALETSNGFCLVQEYKNAPSLATPRNWKVEEVISIAKSVLEVLVYLQSQVPPIIHRDLKPENILVDAELNVYLVDFGLAKLGGEDLAASSTVKGTLGFMPPEQLFNRNLTTASDLYSLAVTLVCLLTKTPSNAIAQLIDDSYCLNFKSNLPDLHPDLANWLTKMAVPNLQKRFPNASEALAALEKVDLSQNPSSYGLQWAIASRAAIFVLLMGAIGWHFTARKSHLSPVSSPLERSLLRLSTTRRCPGCNFNRANLQGIDLRSADLSGADLSGADLSGADLQGASLRHAILYDANLHDANLTQTDFQGAIMPDGTIYP
jgi:serine/threonine protein kinase